MAATAIDADRTHLLALWVGPAAAKWYWAVKQLVDRIEHEAQRAATAGPTARPNSSGCAGNLDALSALAGFDPASASDNWHAAPTHTLRFAEVVAKIYASDFSIGELVYLFTASDHLKGDDPFPLQDANEALDLPLGLPDDDGQHSLWRLRRRSSPSRRRASQKTMPVGRDGTRLTRYCNPISASPPLTSSTLGQHFFPHVLERAGHASGGAASRFTSPLAAADTSAAMWNIPGDGPFQYDPTTQHLSAALPLPDQAVIAKLTHVHTLNSHEQQAVQDVFFQPRVMLPRFACCSRISPRPNDA